MANFIHSINLKCFFLITTLTAFSLTHAVNPGINFNDVAYAVRIERLVDNLKKSKNKSVDQIIDAFVDVKIELELSSQKEIDIEPFVKALDKDLKKDGVHVSKNKFDIIKKKIRKCETKKLNRMRYLQQTMHLDQYELSLFDELNQSKHEDKEDKEEAELPAQFVFGITLCLCGYFLSVLPHPALQNLGKACLLFGAPYCVSPVCDKMDDNKKKEGKK